MSSNNVAVAIKQPNLQIAEFRLIGDAPLVQHKFSEKARKEMMEKQAAGSQSRSKRKHDPKDFDEVYRQSFHFSEDGWTGVPAAAFRSAMIDACRLVGFKMTLAKQAVFVIHDGLDADEGTPLVKLDAPEPEKFEGYARNETGVADIRVRPMWRKWAINLRVRYDADVFSLSDVTNLLARAGMQVGIGEGRPFSRKSHGMGWGTFRIAGENDQ